MNSTVCFNLIVVIVRARILLPTNFSLSMELSPNKRYVLSEASFEIPIRKQETSDFEESFNTVTIMGTPLAGDLQDFDGQFK